MKRIIRSFPNTITSFHSPPRIGRDYPAVAPLMASKDAVSRLVVSNGGQTAGDCFVSTNTLHRMPRYGSLVNGTTGDDMVKLEPWTDVVSDHVMDAQAIARRAVLEDGVVTPTEQAMLDAMHRAQETITAVDAEILRSHQAIEIAASVLRFGSVPRRLRRANNGLDAA